MCTVVFILGEAEIFIGSLRDESPNRQMAFKPGKFSFGGGGSFVAPTDPVSGGTWIGANDQGNVIVLLNGGFENHEKKSCYRASRGLIVSKMLVSTYPLVEWNLIDVQGIEPFTLIVWIGGNLYQLVWDGVERFQLRLDEMLPYIWSSSTLYTAEAKAYRQTCFRNWIAGSPAISKTALLDFFNTYTDAENGFIMNRKEVVKTLSFSFIHVAGEEKASLAYHDFSDNSCRTIKINLHNTLAALRGEDELKQGS